MVYRTLNIRKCKLSTSFAHRWLIPSKEDFFETQRLSRARRNHNPAPQPPLIRTGGMMFAPPSLSAQLNGAKVWQSKQSTLTMVRVGLG